MCKFWVQGVGFLGFVINSDGIARESDCVPVIDDWPTVESVPDVQVLIRFTNLYWRFIRKTAKVTAPISNVLKTQASRKWEWTLDAKLTFQKPKKAITGALILQHFKPQKPIILQTDAGCFTIAGILKQYEGLKILRPVNFCSRKCSTTERTYDTYDRELLAILEAMKQWIHYLESANPKDLMQCNHKNFEYFQTSKVLSWREARWAEILFSYNFIIDHLEGKKNPADRPSRRPDYEIGYDRLTARLLATLATTTVDLYDDLVQEIRTSHAINALAADMKHRIVSTPIINIRDLQSIDELEEEPSKEWKVTTRVLTYTGRICLPQDDLLRTKVISCFHDNPESDLFGAVKTPELVSRDFHWPAKDATVRKYIVGCELCHRIKAPQHTYHVTNMPLPPLL